MKTALQKIQYKTSFGTGTKNSTCRQICGQDTDIALEKTPEADYFTKSDTESKINFRGCNCNGLDSFTLEDFHNKTDKFKIKEYLLLSEDSKSEIRNIVLDFEPVQKAADSSVELAIDYKKFLDEKYGKDKYVFVSIGVSPSLIAKAFECMGVKTKYLPISELSRTYESLKGIDFGNYCDFLKSQGLSSEKIDTDDKIYIFADYTGSGRTLENFERLVKEEFGLSSSKTEFRSVNNDLQQACSDLRKVKEYIDTYFRYADAHNFSSIAHLPVSAIGDIKMSDSKLTHHGRFAPKLFNFAIMDKLDERGLLKENPENEYAL